MSLLAFEFRHLSPLFSTKFDCSRNISGNGLHCITCFIFKPRWDLLGPSSCFALISLNALWVIHVNSWGATFGQFNIEERHEILFILINHLVLFLCFRFVVFLQLSILLASWQIRHENRSKMSIVGLGFLVGEGLSFMYYLFSCFSHKFSKFTPFGLFIFEFLHDFIPQFVIVCSHHNRCILFWIELFNCILSILFQFFVFLLIKFFFFWDSEFLILTSVHFQSYLLHWYMHTGFSIILLILKWFRFIKYAFGFGFKWLIMALSLFWSSFWNLRSGPFIFLFELA